MNFLKNWWDTLAANWQDALGDRNFRIYFTLNFFACVLVQFGTNYWLQSNIDHPGMIVHDPIYAYLLPRDFSRVIFFLTYSCMLIIVLWILQYPLLMQRGFSAFVIVFAVRALCIHLIPLSPSPDIVPLKDPFTNALAGEGRILNDLFFSGHVADLTMFGLLCQNIWLRRYIFLCAFLVALLLVWQRVHYSVDVVMAPAFAYASYWLFVQQDLIWKYFLKKPVFAKTQSQLSAR